jgi:translocation and assembly module TamB
LGGVQSGIRLRKVDASVKLAPDGPDMIRFDAKAQDEWNRAHALSGDIGWQKGAVNARLSNLSLQLPDGAWKLAQPATIKKHGDEFLFENVTLRNGGKGFTIDGRVGLIGDQALSFRLQEFPLETLAELLPQLPKMTGILTVEAQVRGTALAPEITAAAELRDSTIGGQAYGGVVADLSYQKRQAHMNLTVRQDASHTLNATGSLPLALSWQGGWRSEISGPMDAHVRSAGLSLAFLNAYSGKSLDEVDGKLTLDMRARGSFKEPELSGTFRVLDGKLRAIPLGVNVTDIAAEGTLEPRAVNILSLSARAAEGSLNGKGVLALKDNTLDNLKLSLAAKRWPAINTRRYQAQIQGNVDLNGSLTAPKVTGAIEIVEANLRPDLEFLQKSATTVKRDNTIVIVKGTDPVALRKKDGETENFAESMLFKQTNLDIVLRMPGNFWIRHPDGVVELRGNYRLVKQTNAPLDVTGAAEIVRGWVAFQGRRFDLTRGRIEFTGGGKINPALDIVALRRLPQYQVEALVGGTAESPTLTLRSQPHLDQADIVALLIFGKPTKDLNRGEQVSLQQSASALASGYLAGTVIKSISEAIGLDRLGVEFANVDVNNDKVGIGSYIGRNTYVSVSEELAGEKGREVKVEYQIAPEWKVGTSTDSSGSSGVDLIWSKQY